MKTRSKWFCWKLRMVDARRNNHHCHVQENNLRKSRERAQQVRHVGWQSLFHNVIRTNRVRKLVVATGIDFCNIQCHCSCVGHEERGREFVPLMVDSSSSSPRVSCSVYARRSKHTLWKVCEEMAHRLYSIHHPGKEGGPMPATRKEEPVPF